MKLTSTQLFTQHDLNHLEQSKNHKIAKLRADLRRIDPKAPALPKKRKNGAKSETKENPNLKGIDFASIHSHLKSTRAKNTLKADPLTNQPEIKRLMRAVLINWLLEVSSMFSLKARTIFLCGNLLDRYLLSQQVNRSELQLLGVTCLYIASKFEDVTALKAESLASLCDGIYTVGQIKQMESRVLAALNFELIFVSALDIIELKLTCCSVNSKGVRELALVVMSAFLLHGTLNIIDSLKLADFVCVLARQHYQVFVFGDADAKLSDKETAELHGALQKMVKVAHKYKLGALLRLVGGLKAGARLFRE